MAGTVYDVGIHLSAVNGISGVLAVISKEVLGLNHSVDKLQKGFKGLHLGVIGAGLTAVGAGLLDVADHLEKASEKLVHAQTAFAAALPVANRGMDMQIVKAAALNEIHRNLNTTISGNVEHIHDLYNVVQSIPEAVKLLPSFNLLSNAFALVKDQSSLGGAADAKGISSAARAFELTGRTTPEALQAITQGYVQAVIGLRGRVDPNALLQVVQNAGAARYGWSDQFIETALPALINVMKNRAGTALYAIGNNLYGGVTSSLAQGQYQEKYGLHTKADEIRDPKTGRFLGMKPGSIWQSKLLQVNPLNWAGDYLKKLGGMGVNVGDMSTMQKVVASIARGNKQLQAGLDELLLPKTNRQMNKEVRNIQNVPADALPFMKDNDPRAWRNALSSQWDSLEEQLGQSLVPKLINDVLKPLTNALAAINQVGGKNPELFERLANSIVAMGGVMAGAGVAAIVAAMGPAGWFVLGLGALGIAINAIDPTAFPRLTNWIKDLGNAAAATGKQIAANAGDFHGGLKQGLAGTDVSGIETLAGDIANFAKAVQLAPLRAFVSEIGAFIALIPGLNSATVSWKAFGEAVGVGLHVVLTALNDFSNNFIKGLNDANAKMKAAILALPGQVSAAITAAFAKIGAMIGAAISAIPGQIGGAIKSLLSHIDYQPGGSGGGSLLHNAAYHPGGSNDNMARALGPAFSIPNDGSLYSSIIAAEGTAKHGNPYDTALNYMKTPLPLSQMSNDEVMQWAGAHMWHDSSAKGAFQIVNKTQRAAMRALGLKGSDTFSPAEQRKMADWIYAHQGAGAWKGFDHHPNLVPHRHPTVHHIHIEAKLDGRTVARNTVKHIMQANAVPHATADFDGRAHLTPLDYQSATG